MRRTSKVRRMSRSVLLMRPELRTKLNLLNSLKSVREASVPREAVVNPLQPVQHLIQHPISRTNPHPLIKKSDKSVDESANLTNLLDNPPRLW
jgi:hypothetical protein